MKTVWLNHVPCKNNLESLWNFYEDYENLKKFVFKTIDNTTIFKNIGINKKILIKPNWVYHNQNGHDKLCLTTNPNLILAVLEYILILKPKSIIIGDSPIQSCNWELLHSNKFLIKIKALQEIHNTPITIIDFRNEKWEQKKNLQKNCRNESDYIPYNLEKTSLLDPLSIQKKSFRVGDYDPKETIKNHNEGIHKYLIAKEVIESDIIINMPKLKTHQKAGITNGLKNYVGTVGEKAYLAHHSSNLSKGGGDCFPGNNILRKSAEYFSELSYSYKNKFQYYPLHYISSLIWRLAPKSNYSNLGGAWYGNDTVWRMTLDINKIINYGNIEGKISTIKQRKIMTISDAIISGQGEGPLQPTPLPIGILGISDDDGLLDLVMAKLYSFDSNKIPLLRELLSQFNNNNFHLIMDNKTIIFDELGKYSIKAKPPKGWENFIEL